MSRWRPTPAEERWLDVVSELGTELPRDFLIARTGGWRSTGLLARFALFVLGFVAAALLVGILGLGDHVNLLIAGLIAVLVAEWLTVGRRLHASGIEEGLGVAGFLLIGAWITTLIGPEVEFIGGTPHTLVLIAAAGAAGLRRLNPLVTTCAVLVFVHWAGSTTAAHALDAGDRPRSRQRSPSAARSQRSRSRWVRGSSAVRRTTACSTGWSPRCRSPPTRSTQPGTTSQSSWLPSMARRVGLRHRCCCLHSASQCWSQACVADDTRRSWASWVVSPASPWSCALPPRSRPRPGWSCAGSRRWSREWHWIVTCGSRATA